MYTKKQTRVLFTKVTAGNYAFEKLLERQNQLSLGEKMY